MYELDTDYMAMVEETGNSSSPFAVVLRAYDGSEVARKWTVTKEEAELFLKVLQATVEQRLWTEEGGLLH